jgi:hypothetical protein
MRAFVCAIGVVLTTASVTTQSLPHRVTVRVYNTIELARSELAVAQQHVNRIFADAGVGIAWRECRTPRGPSAASPDTCTDVLQPAELMLRLLTSPFSQAEALTTFGYSLVDTGTRSGVLATVYPDRTATTARRLLIDPGGLLAAAVAHELGHLLLGTPAHSADGLMRAHWSDAVLRDDGERAWQLSREEAAQFAALRPPTGAAAEQVVLATARPAASSSRVPGVE